MPSSYKVDKDIVSSYKADITPQKNEIIEITSFKNITHVENTRNVEM